MTNFATDNIAVTSLDRQGQAICVAFTSGHDGKCHQLYVNGRLADWTYRPAQRTLVTTLLAGATELTIAAVDEDQATTDYASRLPPQVACPPWVFRTLVAMAPACPAGSRAVLLEAVDGGPLDEASPLDVAELCPAWLGSTGFGGWSFGQGLWGVGGGGSGHGLGALGLGQFGLDAPAAQLEASFRDERQRTLTLRIEYPDGTASNAPAGMVTPALPPMPPVVEISGYDSGVLRLQVSRSPAE